MFYLGSLKDEKLAQLIVQRLREQEIEASLIQKEDEYGLFVTKKENLDHALDIYRVSLGLPPLKFEIPEQWSEIQKIPVGPFTLNLILICVGIYLLSFTDMWEKIMQILIISAPEEEILFSRILKGEGWRLVTPIFLHFNFMHILFNMMWLKDLGKIIEQEKGPQFFFFFILITSIASNVSQYLVNGPMFGGMSGVVYALLGYLWMKKVFLEDPGFTLAKSDIVLMIGWYVLCITGLFGPIANVAHGIGLAVGMLIGLWITFKQSKLSISKYIQFAIISCCLGAFSIITEFIKLRYL